jgi:flagellar hook protein FlgE
MSQNVANSNSTGYKELENQFSALVDESPGQSSTGAGVTTSTQALNAMQGQIESTSTTTDLAVEGAGFFVVSDANGNIFLTRNGSFVPDSQGNLVNAAGYYLMGANTQGTTSSASVNSVSGLQKVNIQGAADSATPSTSATMVANLPSTATAIAAANLPSTNTANSKYTDETTVVAYDNLGGAHTINVYYAKTGTNTWEVDAYDSGAASATGGFPYSSGPLATQTLTFNPTSGALTSGSPLSFTTPGGQPVSMDLSQTTQLATAFAVNSSTINGNAPGSLTGVAISSTGVLSFQYGNGASQNAYLIPLANVPSPDNLTAAQGDAYQTNGASGNLQVGNAGSGGLGTIDSSSLEESTVDLATELTSMVEAQSAYQANSKVFQTGADILDILNNLKS